MSNCTVNPVIDRVANATQSFMDALFNSLEANVPEAKGIKRPNFAALSPYGINKGVEEVNRREHDGELKISTEKEISKSDPIIGTAGFSTYRFASDVADVATSFGYSKEILFGSLKSEQDIYEKALETLDLILGFLHLVPMDNIDEVKNFTNVIAKGIRSYLPKLSQISTILAASPALNKYAKVLVGIGSSLDKTMEILADTNEETTVSKAIESLRESIKSLKKIDITDLNKSSIKDGDEVVVAEVSEGKKRGRPRKEDAEKKAEDKKEEAKAEGSKVEVVDGKEADKAKPADGWVVSDKTVQDAAAFQQQIMQQAQPVPQQIAPQQMVQYPQPFPPELYVNPENSAMPVADSFVPEFLNGKLDGVQAPAIPEYMQQNYMRVPKVPVEQQIFSPIKQEIAAELQAIFQQYPWAGEIGDIINKNGYFYVVGMIANNTMIAFQVYNGNGIIPDKSFVIDLGVVIDKRLAIWPCYSITNDGKTTFVEYCNEAYHLLSKEGNLNADFIEQIIKYGFAGIDKATKKTATVYTERLCATNRKFALITLFKGKMEADNRRRLRGAAIRMSDNVDDKFGRFECVELSEKTMVAIWTNQGAPMNYGGPVVDHPVCDIVMIPERDEEGKFIPINSKGVDIKYDIRFIERGSGRAVTSMKNYKDRLGLSKRKTEKNQAQQSDQTAEQAE